MESRLSVCPPILRKRVSRGELATIDLHHGSYSADPPYSTLQVIAAAVSENIKLAMGEYGFEEFRSNGDGFEAIPQT
jgi:hypothetical protein